jgi:hypothetical protein
MRDHASCILSFRLYMYDGMCAQTISAAHICVLIILNACMHIESDETSSLVSSGENRDLSYVSLTGNFLWVVSDYVTLSGDYESRRFDWFFFFCMFTNRDSHELVLSHYIHTCL